MRTTHASSFKNNPASSAPKTHGLSTLTSSTTGLIIGLTNGLTGNCSTLLIAALLKLIAGLLNAGLLNAGRLKLGLLNPALALDDPNSSAADTLLIPEHTPRSTPARMNPNLLPYRVIMSDMI